MANMEYFENVRKRIEEIFKDSAALQKTVSCFIRLLSEQCLP